MLILLPPSEGKTAPERGSKLALTRLSDPSLTSARKRAVNALVSLCAKQPTRAAAVLGLGPRQVGEITRNARLRTASAGPAIRVYSGVLYGALDADTLTAPAQRRLQTHVRIASALFGLLKPDDRIPAYRLSADAVLPGLGPLPDVWRDPVSAILQAQNGLILDLRSGAYCKLGPVPQSALTGRVLLEKQGKRSVVSHHNKATKGRLVRGLVQRGAMPKNETQLIDALQTLGFRCELHEATRVGHPATLDIIVTDV